MLRRISEPLALSEASLLMLRPALNAPVLNVDFLPVGPARAAIVVFAEEYGGIGLALGIRSTEGGQVAVFRNREAIEELSPLAESLEPALAEAERMGFLFDEDMIDSVPGGEGRAQATALWADLMGEIAMPPARAARTVRGRADAILDLGEPLAEECSIPELMLEAIAPAERSRISSEPESVAAAAAPERKTIESPEEMPPVRTLSKFRQAPIAADLAEAPERGPDLGRIPLVRRRVGERARRIPYLARLLSSF